MVANKRMFDINYEELIKCVQRGLGFCGFRLLKSLVFSQCSVVLCLPYTSPISEQRNVCENSCAQLSCEAGQG